MKNEYITNLVELNTVVPNTTLRGIYTEPRNRSPIAFVFALPGFERRATTERKFTALAERLAQERIAMLRLDPRGLGLSSGDYGTCTIPQLADEARRAILNTQPLNTPLILVAHSMGACLAAQIMSHDSVAVRGAVFLSPALNQHALQRYWFVRRTRQDLNPLPNWGNYTQYVDEPVFQRDCSKLTRLTKENTFGHDYFKDAAVRNHETDFASPAKRALVMHIHGQADQVAPADSVRVKFAQHLLLKGGDHDLERPDILIKWLAPAITFIHSRLTPPT